MHTKSFKHLFILFFLFCFWIVSSALTYLETSNGHTALTYNHYNEISISPVTKKMFAGEKIKGEFTATENYLGTIVLPVQANDPNENTYTASIIFRIKEKGAQSWYHVNNYSKPPFVGDKYFPFGFPVINDSKNKTYDFEIELVRKTFKGYLNIKNIQPKLISKYNFPKHAIFANGKTFIEYCLKNIQYSTNDPRMMFELVLYSFIYAIPLILYVIATTFTGFRAIFTVLFLGINIEIFLLRAPHDFVYLVLLLSWITVLLVGKKDYQITFIFALIFLFLGAILLPFYYQFAANAMQWVFLLLTIGILHLFYIYFQEMLKAKSN